MTTIAAPTRFVHSENSDEPLESRCLTLRGFLTLVDTLTAAGLAPPPEFQELSARLARLGEAVANGRTMQHRLTQAVVYGNGADIEALYSSALAEHSAAAPDVIGPLHAEALAHAQRLYADSAANHYVTLARRFNASANAFAKCCALIDPATPSSEVINEHPNTVQAWRDAQEHAQALSGLVEPLVCAAEILRAGQPSGLGGSRTALELPLLADLDGVHRRAAWCAWSDEPEPKAGPLTTEMRPEPHQPTRCGRWARLVAIGATLRAHENPELLELYSGPPPFAIKQVTPPGPGDNPRKAQWQRVDPCDAELEANPPKGPLARLRAMARRHDMPEPNIVDTVLGDTDEGTDHA
jgi:hypothetical protein